MSTTIEQRVRALESGGGRECPECGFDGDWSKVEYTVNVDEHVSGPDNCPECGRALVIHVGWGDRGEGGPS